MRNNGVSRAHFCLSCTLPSKDKAVQDRPFLRGAAGSELLVELSGLTPFIILSKYEGTTDGEARRA